ncbi:MAG: alcohol dehydrogenase catalytic domain-containing protein [Anaerolineae bacterium]|nr:alcohol dehydrogenase catalytic domain-containing protein [Anaerolineae bacterium]
MRALYCDNGLKYISNHPRPEPLPGEALVRVTWAGICNTDLELVRGYMAFRGILGHEFTGVVVWAEDSALLQKRVVGEINANCGRCETCRSGLPTHCPQRTTVGIYRRDGAFADYISIPAHLLHQIPEAVPDREAVFTEPLAAALQVTEQLRIHPTDRVLVVGDGKLGQLIAQVLVLTGCNLAVIGKHERKLSLLRRRGIAVYQRDDEVKGGADVVIECTGSAQGFERARSLVRPRGTLVLKSTYHGQFSVDLSKVVVDELTIVGSRCGPFAPALSLLEKDLVDVESMIDTVYPLDQGMDAFADAAAPGVLKILLRMDVDA